MIVLLLVAIQAFSDFQRLDPHGLNEVNFKEAKAFKNECTVCHSQDKGAVKLKSSASESCQTCHNSAPHSGVAEHMSRIYHNTNTNNNEPINCMSCHSPHRNGSIELTGTSHMIRIVRDIKEPLVLRDSKKAMLKRKCEDCHKW